MHLPVSPASLARPFLNAYRYFRTGVTVEGTARLCEDAHMPLVAIGDNVLRSDPVPQHIDVELRFWNRRGGRVTIIEIAEMKILSRLQRLTVADWKSFEMADLEAGAPPVTREFVLVPKDDKGRVEVSCGEVLELRFRPSRGSERWAQPRIQMPLL